MDADSTIEAVALFGMLAIVGFTAAYFLGWGLGLAAAGATFIGCCAWEIITGWPFHSWQEVKDSYQKAKEEAQC